MPLAATVHAPRLVMIISGTHEYEYEFESYQLYQPSTRVSAVVQSECRSPDRTAGLVLGW